MTKVGLLGAGSIGAIHAAAYAQISDARLVAIADG
jgi:predicted dehydrogenase